MKNILTILMLLIISVNLFSIEQVVRITLPSDDIREECRRLHIVPDKIIENNIVEIVLTEKEIDEIISLGYPVEVMIEDYSDYLRQLYSSPDFAQYHNYSQTVAFIESLAQANTNIVRVETLGYSVQGRVIQAMKITDNPDVDEFEAEVRFDGTHHGDEPPAIEVCLWLAKRLCEGYGSVSYITSYVNNRETWIIPLINPDGRTVPSRYNANGVDLNREYGYMWDREGNSAYPFSQPESQALRSLMDTRNFTIAGSYHTGILYISQAWSYHYDRPYDHDAYMDIWSVYAAITGYPHEQGSHGMYYINGPTKDYDYGPSGCIGSTVEVSQIKFPPANTLAGICALNDSAMFEMIRLSGQGIAGYVTDSVTGDPLWARVTVIEKDWPIFTDRNFGDYHRYVLPGTYSIRVSAPGYREKTVSNITTYTDTFTRVDIALAPMDTSFAFKVVLCNVPNYNDQNHTVTPHALGESDGNYLSLGVSYQSGQRDGWIIFDMGPETPVFNGSGYDFIVVEGNDGTTEACSVFVGEYPTWPGPWSFVGMVTGSGEMDISSSGLGQARYVMLVDDGNGSYSGGSPGYDVDAVVNYGRPQNASVVITDHIFNPVLPYPGDSISLVITLSNFGLNTATNVSALVLPLTPDVTMIDSLVNIDSIPSGDSIDLPSISFEVSSSMPLGTLVDLEVEVNGSGKFTFYDTLSVFVGFEEFCDSVENGQGAWTHSGQNDLWHITEHKSHSPTHSWYCGNEGSWQYSNNMNASLVTPTIVIANNCVLEFWEEYATESGWDYIHIEYSTDGSNWNSLRSTSGSSNWQLSSFNLDMIPIGSSVQFRFRLASDGNTLREGWYVDDIRVYNPTGVVEELPLFPEIGNIEINSLSSLRNNGAVLMISGVNESNPGRVLIFDITGRKLYDSHVVRSGRFVWNGSDNRNVTVGTGNYFAVLRTEAGNSYCKFTIIK